jgi:hypothetical protein
MKFLLLSTLSLLTIMYQSISFNYDCDALALCLKSKEFQRFINLDNIDGHEITLFDASGYFNNCDTFRIDDKIFKRVIPDFKVEVNETETEGVDKIILVKVEKADKATRFTFFLSSSNSSIILEVGDKGKIKVISRGQF